MRLSLVVPCYNEVDVIIRFHEALSKELAATEQAYEILYVDDGSADGTLDKLVELAGSDKAIRYLSFSRNFGKESAMLAGLRYSTGDAVVIMDADLQHPPELIGRMLEQYERGFDQVIARRTRTGDPATRTLFARAYYWLINRWADVELMDGVGDFRLLSRRAVNGLLELNEYNRFSKGLFAWIGFESILFEYENVKQPDRKSRWTFRRLLEYGFDGLLSFNNKPLRLAIYVGLLLTAVAAGYAVWVIAVAILNGVAMPGYVTLIAAIVGLGGLQMVMLGLIGEYIGRIYYETKQRPHYLLKQSNMNPADRLDTQDDRLEKADRSENADRLDRADLLDKTGDRLDKKPAPDGRATRGR
jgi:glycosyltransferase involved in cell wall biosynthesis